MSNPERMEFADELMQKLYCGQGEDALLLRYLDIQKSDSEQFFSTYMKLLCEIDMDEEEAKYHYKQIQHHEAKLERAAGRTLGFRVAMLDYLLNINPKLECPKIIEFSTYTTMLAQTTLDGLTGVFNRRYFDNQLCIEINRSKRYNHTFSLLLLDIDDFKKVNDTYGHTAGDHVLEEFAGILKNHLRSEDIAARYGGEEFTLLLPQTDLKGAKIFAERLLEKAGDFLYSGGIRVTFSGGIANYPHHGISEKELIETADKGLYESKLRGKNRITVLQEERRDNTRYPVEAPLLFSVHSDTTDRAILKNISLTGIAGESPLSLSAGDIINLQFTHPEERKEYEILAQVIWAEKHKQSKDHAFGAQYRNQNRNRLYKIVSQYIPAEHTDSPAHQPMLFE